MRDESIQGKSDSSKDEKTYSVCFGDSYFRSLMQLNGYFSKQVVIRTWFSEKNLVLEIHIYESIGYPASEFQVLFVVYKRHIHGNMPF